MLFLKNSRFSDALDNALYSEKQIFQNLNNFHYTCGQASLKEFSEKYNSSGWLGRKVIAIPAALLIGIVKTVYNLGSIIFKLCIFGKTSAKIQCYRLARDLQISYGWLVTFFDDEKGRYLVQKSQFNKSCYDFINVTDQILEQMVDAQAQMLNEDSPPEKIYEVANKYMYLGCWDKAYGKLNKIFDEPHKKIQLKIEIVKKCFAEGHSSSMKIFANFTRALPKDQVIRNDFMMFVAKLALIENDPAKKVEILQLLVKALFAEAHLNDLVFSMLFNSKLTDFIKDFFHGITVNCVSKLVAEADETATQNVLLTTITTIISQKSTLDAFLDLNLLADSKNAYEDFVLEFSGLRPLEREKMDKTRALIVLGVKNPDSAEEIREAYRKKIFEFHPDKIKQEGEEQVNFESRLKQAPVMFRQVKEAWEVLKANPVSIPQPKTDLEAAMVD